MRTLLMRVFPVLSLLTISAVNSYADSYVLRDDSVENPSGVSTGNWWVRRFLGNTRAGNAFYQGAALEVGGVSSVLKAVETPHGVYVVVGAMYSAESVALGLVQNDNFRLLMEAEGDMTGPVELCQGGYPLWSVFDQTLYVVGPNCLRKLVTAADGSWRVALVAGTCKEAGDDDGDALATAKLRRSKGVAAASDGTIYWLEQLALRKIKDGLVSTVSLDWVVDPEGSETETMPYWGTPDSLMDDNLSMGRDDDTLYINDYYDPKYKSGVLKADLKALTIRKWVGSPNTVTNAYWTAYDATNGTSYLSGAINDGPRREAARLSGGGAAKYYDFYGALVLDGNDNNRYRWLKDDSDNVTTILGVPLDPATYPKFDVFQANSPGGFDGRSFWASNSAIRRFVGDGSGEGIYAIIASDKIGLFRAYDRTLTDGSLVFPDTSVNSSRDGRIKAAIVQTDGTLESTSFVVSPLASGVQSQPKVAYLKGTYLVVWAQLSGDDWDVYGVRIGDDGTALDTTPIPIDVRSRTQSLPDVAADDEGFMVVWGGFEGTEQFPNIYASRVPLSGEINDTTYPKVIGVGTGPKIAWNSNAAVEKFLVVHNTGSGKFSAQQAWTIIDSTAEIVPGNERYPWKYSARTPQNHSVCALPGSQGWTWMTDSDDHYNFFVKGKVNAFTVTPNGEWDSDLTDDPLWEGAYSADYNKESERRPPWFLDHEADTPTQWPKGQNDLAMDSAYAVAVWARHDRSALDRAQFESYNSNLYIGRLDKFDLVEGSGVPLATSSDGERNPAIAGDGNGNLVVVYEKLLKGNRQIASKYVDISTEIGIDPTENILVDENDDLWRGYPDISYNTDDDNYMVVWQEGFHGLSMAPSVVIPKRPDAGPSGDDDAGSGDSDGGATDGADSAPSSGCGCASAGSNGSGLGVIVALACLVALRRRRR